MDKNTIYGLVLMALVFLGFMWLQPKKEQIPEDTSDVAQQEEAATLSNPQLSANEMDWLKKNIAANGDITVLDDGRRVFRYSDRNFDLTLDGDSIYGTGSSGSNTVSLAQLFEPSHG
ncbi:MAG: hypothetical protein K2J15_03620, partial [Muribaculaceae bacterium]|nr:hypothetical protein [Muribaculaceae bacterium]